VSSSKNALFFGWNETGNVRIPKFVSRRATNFSVEKH